MKIGIMVIFIATALFAQYGEITLTGRHNEIQAFLKDGKTIKDTSIFYKRIKGQCLFLDEEDVFPSQTDSIKIGSLTGIPALSGRSERWVWRILDGKVSAFANQPDLRSNEFSYLKKGGTFVPFSIGTLRDFVKDNKKSVRLVDSYRKSRITGYTLLAVGLGGMIGGLGYGIYYNETNRPTMFDTPQTNPIFLAGAVITVGACVPFVITKKNIQKALKIYNR